MIDEAIRVGKKLAEQHLIDGSSGNLSFVDGGEMVITKSGAVLDELTPDDFVRVDFRGTDRSASSDLEVHRKVYEKTNFRAVLHCHGSYNVALSLLEDGLIPVDLEGRMFLGEIRFIEGKFGTERYAELISDEIRKNGFAVVKGHGIYAAGRSFMDAFKLASFVEHSCKVYYLVRVYSLLCKQ
ncbi:class II aldolase/adducin family protein [Geoglobus acetivorans]|uniref:Fructose-bisphosphate aldolase n=1 Tax=Geoglobus acetivorans TaxID=565033 RepID=A0A0A7GE07_GEOAI|nr:fructose-bisphosphate aldolase [Geoglobus acetivorans]